LYLDAQNENSLQQIQYLENRQRPRSVEPDKRFPAPQFLRPLQNFDVIEGEQVHLETVLEPAGDPKMKVQWFFNGQPISEGKAFSTKFKK